MSDKLLEIKDLKINFHSDKQVIEAVKGVSFDIEQGENVAIVGESGSGKSTTAHAIINLLPGTGEIIGGSIKLHGEELVGLPNKKWPSIRGSQIGLIPQDPLSNLNPVWNIGFQVKEALRANNVDTNHEKFRTLEKDISNLDEEQLANTKFISSKTVGSFFNKLSEIHPDLTDELKDQLLDFVMIGSTTKQETAKKLQELGLLNEATETLLTQSFTGASIDDRVLGLLKEAGLKEMTDKVKYYPHEFSGGMRQRVLITIGLAARPALIIADEPTSALDVTVQKVILDRLEVLTKALGTTMLLITHDLGLAAERAKKLVVMYKGVIVESGDAIEILKNPQHPYTKRLIAAAPTLKSKRLVSTKARSTRASISADVNPGPGTGDSTNSPSLEGVAPTGDGVVQDAGSATPDTEDNIIVAEHLTKEFVSRGLNKKVFKAVDDVSFKLKRGTTLGIVGESGSGKSTAANMVLKLLKPTNGKIFFEDEDISNLSNKQMKRFRRHVQPIFQNPYGSLDPMFSIFRAIEEPLKIHKIGNKKFRENRVRELLDMVGLPEATMSRYPNELSGGQRQRIAVARALALEPEVIVCDEAVSALDVIVQDQVLNLLNDLQAELGLSYLFITHDLGVIKQIADYTIVMEHGKLVEQGETEQIIAHPVQEYTKELIAAVPGSQIAL
jgi:peptide/nickel transport system ATP-binding protein